MSCSSRTLLLISCLASHVVSSQFRQANAAFVAADADAEDWNRCMDNCNNSNSACRSRCSNSSPNRRPTPNHSLNRHPTPNRRPNHRPTRRPTRRPNSSPNNRPNRRPGSSICTYSPDYRCYANGWPRCCDRNGGRDCPSSKARCEKDESLE